jgi:hypothetical protein
MAWKKHKLLQQRHFGTSSQLEVRNGQREGNHLILNIYGSHTRVPRPRKLAHLVSALPCASRRILEQQTTEFSNEGDDSSHGTIQIHLLPRAHVI